MTDVTTDAPWESATPNPHHIPSFEGNPVEFTKAKLTSVSALEINDEVLRMDQVIRMFVEGRVVNIAHVVNEKTGKMERVQTIKAIDVEIVDWDADRS